MHAPLSAVRALRHRESAARAWPVLGDRWVLTRDRMASHPKKVHIEDHCRAT
jgi:hypothetical protein